VHAVRLCQKLSDVSPDGPIHAATEAYIGIVFMAGIFLERSRHMARA